MKSLDWKTGIECSCRCVCLWLSCKTGNICRLKAAQRCPPADPAIVRCLQGHCGINTIPHRTECLEQATCLLEKWLRRAEAVLLDLCLLCSIDLHLMCHDSGLVPALNAFCG